MKIFRPARLLLLALVGGALIYMLTGTSDSDLELWHTEHLDEEFSTEKLDEISSFAEYLRLEEELFSEMGQSVTRKIATGPEFELVRYSSGSVADPQQFSPNWNRSFELPVERPAGAVLLLHGMSDSPYSLRGLALSLHQRNFWVLGLRLPGHGTIPSALKHVRWEDMDAAVKLAASHLLAKTGELPLHLVGYSTGAALAMNYAIEHLSEEDEPPPASLILISPAIGIHPAARLAVVKDWLSNLPGLGELAWLSIEPEFDPYKYNSFATNAGTQVSRLTRSVTQRINQLAKKGPVERFPPVVVFKSTVDATVSNRAIVENLLRPLGNHGHELLIFDINRYSANSPLIAPKMADQSAKLIEDATLPTTVSLLTNRSSETREVHLQRSPSLSGDIIETAMVNTSWPAGVFSLSHIALPFPPDDPLYGRQPPDDERRLFLGQMTVKGERGLLKIPADYFIRLRHNPFYSLLETRAVDWVVTHSQRQQ
jgi:alpha-beta hydrolase superfamily lysophospholipase